MDEEHDLGIILIIAYYCQNIADKISFRQAKSLGS